MTQNHCSVDSNSTGATSVGRLSRPIFFYLKETITMFINTNDIIFWIGVIFGVVGSLIVVFLSIVVFYLFYSIKDK